MLMWLPYSTYLPHLGRLGFPKLLEKLLVNIHLIRTIKKDKMISLNDYLKTLMRYFLSDFRYKSICCWYSFELPRLVEAIQKSTNNVCLLLRS